VVLLSTDETGYLTLREDCSVIADELETPARAIVAGIILYLSECVWLKPDALVARAYNPVIIESDQATAVLPRRDRADCGGSAIRNYRASNIF
jgi:hypothetical protein